MSLSQMTPDQAEHPLILALDASTTAVGWCLAGDELRQSGVYVPKGGSAFERICDVGHWLSNLYLDHQEIAVVAYERATGGQYLTRAGGKSGNKHTDRVLGALEYECWRIVDRRGIWFLTVTASQVRASGCHKNALAVAESLKGAPLDDHRPGDEADAIGVWLAAKRLLAQDAWLEKVQ